MQYMAMGNTDSVTSYYASYEYSIGLRLDKLYNSLDALIDGGN